LLDGMHRTATSVQVKVAPGLLRDQEISLEEANARLRGIIGERKLARYEAGAL
jgi:hypothetical protein